jgi:hypothetical protein
MARGLGEEQEAAIFLDDAPRIVVGPAVLLGETRREGQPRGRRIEGEGFQLLPQLASLNGHCFPLSVFRSVRRTRATRNPLAGSLTVA